MSTILDALRKVESERESPRDQMLHAPAPPPESRVGRRNLLPAIIVCAVIGFSGGAVLSWRLAQTPPAEVASLPAPPAPPAIAVPRPPVHARKVEAPAAPRVATAPAADQARPPGAEVAPVNPPAAAAPAEAAPPSSDTAVASAPPAEIASAVPTVPAPKDGAPVAVLSAPAAPGPLAPRKALAAADTQESALEPSPFAGARGAAAPLPVVPPVDAGKRIAALPKPLAPSPAAEDKLAALTPPPLPEPEAPALDAVPPPEPEPETPAEPIFDTGRSPPGAPKVALSFLQWSADPEKRFAFISIDGAPTQRVHEGEVAAGMTVAAITPNGVQFKREGQTFVIRPRH